MFLFDHIFSCTMDIYIYICYILIGTTSNMYTHACERMHVSCNPGAQVYNEPGADVSFDRTFGYLVSMQMSICACMCVHVCVLCLCVCVCVISQGRVMVTDP